MHHQRIDVNRICRISLDWDRKATKADSSYEGGKPSQDIRRRIGCHGGIYQHVGRVGFLHLDSAWDEKAGRYLPTCYVPTIGGMMMYLSRERDRCGYNIIIMALAGVTRAYVQYLGAKRFGAVTPRDF